MLSYFYLNLKKGMYKIVVSMIFKLNLQLIKIQILPSIYCWRDLKTIDQN